MKPSPALIRQINATKRELRRARRGRQQPARDAIWTALTSLTELRLHPTRPGLAVQVAMNVQRARLAAGAI